MLTNLAFSKPKFLFNKDIGQQFIFLSYIFFLDNLFTQILALPTCLSNNLRNLLLFVLNKKESIL